jgi:Fic family protein
MGCLAEWEHALRDTSMPPLLHAGLIHYQFEAIHPFLDGNGRVGRLLITLLLVERDVLPTPLLYLSAFFEATRRDYYDRLLAVSRESKWEDWLEYFLNGVARQSDDAVSRAERINELLDHWRLKVAGAASRTPALLLDMIAENPFVTANRAAERLGVAFTTAQRAIRKLKDASILEEVGEARRDRVYCAKAILDILEEPARLMPG